VGLKIHRPRRGSMAYYPRKRSETLVPKIYNWPQINVGKPMLLSFAAYKAGMAHVVMVDDRQTSPFYGKEIVRPVTVLDAPPMRVVGVRGYAVDPFKVLKVSVGEAWVSEVPNYLRRVLTLPEKINTETAMSRLQSRLNELTEIRVIAVTQPHLSGIGKKTPEIMEIPVGGTSNVDELFKYASSLLGKELSARDVLKEGQLVDVIGITKGKGTQGVVKRFGVMTLPKWNKMRKGYRRTGTASPQNPAVMFTIPKQGQTGLHRRTEYNKRVLAIGDNGAEVTPKSGFPHYGVIRGSYIIIEGSVPGAIKRLIGLRYPIRPPPRYDYVNVNKPQVQWVSTQAVTR